MEFTLINKKNVKHAVVVLSQPNEQQLYINVIRLHTLGGTPSTIMVKMDGNASYRDVMTKLKTIVNFDSEMYAMVAEHTK